jgi:hypothetical protein
VQNFVSTAYSRHIVRRVESRPCLPTLTSCTPSNAPHIFTINARDSADICLPRAPDRRECGYPRSFTSLPSAHDLGGENPYIDTKDVFEASELWVTRPSGCWSPLERAPRGEKLPKDCPTAEVLLEAKAAALHPERYQSSLSKLSTKREGEAGKEAQAIGLASQSDGQKSDGQIGD